MCTRKYHLCKCMEPFMPTDAAHHNCFVTTVGAPDIMACQVIKEFSAPAVEFFLKLLGRSGWDL